MGGWRESQTDSEDDLLLARWIVPLRRRSTLWLHLLLPWLHRSALHGG